MTTAATELGSVRYLIDDVRAAVDFYTTHLGFTVAFAAPVFADVRRGPLRLLLSGPTTSGLTFRSDLVSGPGGRQILLADPSGNLIELFQPAPRPA
jgi:catechol 2,3-dioxygenase-like lactoylglutathione lyase family enzyme